MCQDPQGKSAPLPGIPSYFMLSTRPAAMQETRTVHDPNPRTRFRGQRGPAKPKPTTLPTICLCPCPSLPLPVYLPTVCLSIIGLYLSPIIYLSSVYLSSVSSTYLLSSIYLSPTYMPIYLSSVCLSI